MSNLNAHYIFYSSSTGNTYIMSLQTGPLTNPIPNCQGYSVISGTFTITDKNGDSQKYTVPPGKTLFIYNGLWPDAAASPDGAPLCQGIGRLYINFSQQSNNTSIYAISENSIGINEGSGNPDTAILLNAIFPPQ